MQGPCCIVRVFCRDKLSWVSPPVVSDVERFACRASFSGGKRDALETRRASAHLELLFFVFVSPPLKKKKSPHFV